MYTHHPFFFSENYKNRLYNIDKMRLKNASEKSYRNTLEPNFIYYFFNFGGQRKKDSFRCCPFGEGIFVYGVKQKLYNVLGGFTSIMIPCPHLKVFTKFYLFTKPFYASYIKRNFSFSVFSGKTASNSSLVIFSLSMSRFAHACSSSRCSVMIRLAS